jgi:REP element-mobilizing transposase RayT
MVSAAYLITFTCFGTRLRADRRTAEPCDSACGNCRPDGIEVREQACGLLGHPPYLLDAARRAITLAAIEEACGYSNWNLLAAGVRRGHVHVVVESDRPPEHVMNRLKTYADRSLNHMEAHRRRWSAHGSTRRLREKGELSAAIDYVAGAAGE